MKLPQISPLKLPRKLVAHPQHDALEKLLTQDRRPLWENGTIQVVNVEFTPALEDILLKAQQFRQLVHGLERIDQILSSEQKGLLALHEKQGTAPVNRVSRVLLISNDGAERFYRACESTLLHHGDRVLGLYVNADSARMGHKLFGPARSVKALLVSDREAVTHVLLSLLER